MRCLAMGEPWVVKHPQSDMINFAIVDMEWAEQFSEEWRKTVNDFKAPQSVVQQAIAKDVAESEGAEVADTAKGKAKAAGKAKGKGKAKAKATAKAGAEPGPPSDGEGKKMYMSLIKDALAFKAMLVDTSHKALNVIDAISANPDWDFAKKTKKDQQLSDMMLELRTQMTPWQQDLMVQEWKDCKGKSTEMKIKEEFRTLLTLKPRVTAISGFVKGLLEAKQAMPK